MKNCNFLDLPFIGRSQELSFLKIRFEQALEYNGNCVFIHGDPGIGKSVLLNVFLDRIGNDVLCIRADVDTTRNHARDLMIQIIRTFLDKTDFASRTIPRVIDFETFNEFVLSVPELSTYFPYEPQRKQINPRNIPTNAMFVRLITGLSRLTPVVLAVEDIHIAEPDLLEMLANMLSHVSILPVLIIVTAENNHKIATWLKQLNQKKLETLVLHKLTHEDIVELNRQLFENDLKPDFFLWLHTQTQGVPLYINEFLRTLFEKGIIYFNDRFNRWDVIESYKDMAIPDTISGILQERLRGLTHQELALLKFAAICGTEFDLRFLVPNTRDQSLVRLERLGIIVRKGTSYSFSHPLIRELIYQTLDVNERMNIHNELAHLFLKQGDKERAVNHFSKTHKQDTVLLNMLADVSKQSKQKGDMTREVVYLEKALSIAQSIFSKSDRRLITIMSNYAAALANAGKFDKSLEIASNALALVNIKTRVLSKNAHARLYRIQSQVYIRMGKYKDAITVINRGIRLLRESTNTEARETMIELLTYKAFAYKYQWQSAKALKIAMRIKNILGHKTKPYYRFLINNLLGSIYHQKGQNIKSTAFREDALTAAKESGIESLMATAHGNLGISYTSIGEFKKSMVHLLKHQQYNIEAGRSREEVMSYYNICCNYLAQGYLDKAEHECLKGMNMSTMHDLCTDQIWLLRSYAQIHLLQDKYEEVQKHLNKGIDLARKSSAQYSLYFLQVHKGFMLFGLAKWKQLKEHIEFMKKEFKEQFINEAAYSLLQGLLCILRGKKNNGIRSVKKGIRLIEQNSTPIALIKVLYILIKLFHKRKVGKDHIKFLIDQATCIAEQYDMKAWLDTLHSQSKLVQPEPIHVFCLGKMRIEHPVAGLIRTDQWRWARPRQLFALLIAAYVNQKTLDRDSIGAIMWPSLSADKMINNFHVCLSQLKKVIGKDYIITKNGQYMLNKLTVDVLEFQELFERSDVLLRAGKIHMAEKTLKQVIELYTGDFLLDIYDPWIDETRAKYEGMQRKALLMLGEIYLKKFQFDQSIQAGRTVLHYDPFDEEAHRLLMRAYAASGRKPKAIEQYKRCVAFLKTELRYTPSIETRQLYRKIAKM